jgi:hypothetical protein
LGYFVSGYLISTGAGRKGSLKIRDLSLARRVATVSPTNPKYLANH